MEKFVKLSQCGIGLAIALTLTGCAHHRAAPISTPSTTIPSAVCSNNAYLKNMVVLFSVSNKR